MKMEPVFGGPADTFVDDFLGCFNLLLLPFLSASRNAFGFDHSIKSAMSLSRMAIRKPRKNVEQFPGLTAGLSRSYPDRRPEDSDRHTTLSVINCRFNGAHDSRAGDEPGIA
jgi:hypothetical protein